MTLFAAVFDKLGLRTRYVDTRNPYPVALHFCMERLHVMLSEEGQHGRTVHVIFESRGRRRIGRLSWSFVGSLPTTAAPALAGRISACSISSRCSCRKRRMYVFRVVLRAPRGTG